MAKPQVRWRSANSTSDYYDVMVAGDERPVSVVHTKFDTFVCLACRSCDCDHALAVEPSDQFRPRPPVA